MKAFAKSCAVALLLCSGLTAGAQASVIFSNNVATPDTALPGHYDYSFAAASQRAIASIEIRGYNTLDGQNDYEDDFTLALNGVTLYHATFNLGGGGANVVYQEPAGSTFAVTSLSDGGLADISVPLALASGANTLTLSYFSVKGGDQGIGDEGFGIDSVNVAGVPLPASAPMFGAALAVLGLAGYRLRRKNAAA